jgi:tRNA A-37 threonylcarbamoyl transferase component Bud32
MRLVMKNIMTVNNIKYSIDKLLGHGKGGYSYLAMKDDKQYVLKQIHHEPCDYYTFGNKIEAERYDYNRLLKTGIRIPKMLDIDIEKERVLKEYIDGPTIYDLVDNDQMNNKYICQVREMAEKAYEHGLNIDYFPTNFVVQDDIIYYIDYECNNYMDEWNFENWGIKYWSKTEEFMEYKSKH